MTSLEDNRRPKFLENQNQQAPEQYAPGHDPRFPNERYLSDAVAAGTMEYVSPEEAERQRRQAQFENTNANRSEDNQSRNNRRGLFIAGGAIAATGAIALSAFFGVKAAHNEQIEKFTNPTTSQEYENVTDPAEMSIEQFNTLSRIQQLDYAGPALNSSIEADTDLVLSQLERTGWDDYNYLNREIAQPSIDNTPQEIWDQITLGYAHVRNLASSGDSDDIAEAKKIAHGVAEGGAYDLLTDGLATDGPNFSEIAIAYEDERTEPVKSDGSYYGIDANGSPISSFVVEHLATSEFSQTRVVVRFVEGTDAESSRWIVAKTDKLAP